MTGERRNIFMWRKKRKESFGILRLGQNVTTMPSTTEHIDSGKALERIGNLDVDLI
jgi:hypothetical protein